MRDDLVSLCARVVGAALAIVGALATVALTLAGVSATGSAWLMLGGLAVWAAFLPVEAFRPLGGRRTVHTRGPTLAGVGAGYENRRRGDGRQVFGSDCGSTRAPGIHR